MERMLGAKRRITYLSWNAAPVLVAACVVVGGATAASGACIPDLPANTQEPTAFCGDGIIELDAGETCDPSQPGAGDASISNCANCKMQCPGGLLWENHHCYQLTRNSTLFPELGLALRQLCQSGHLVTFASEEEYQAVAGYFDASSFWVGLETAPMSPGTGALPPVTLVPPSSPSPRYSSVAPYEPGWQTMCPGCYAHTSDPSSPLPTTPDASPDGASEDCVVALSGDQDAAWHQYPCSTLLQPLQSFARIIPPRVICEVEPVGVQSAHCEAGVCIDLVKTYGKKRYIYGPKSVSASDANKACNSLGARLVVLESHEEREQLWRELFRIPGTPSGAWGVWIGLSQVPQGLSGNGFRPPTWQWDDGTPDDGTYPSPWGTNQPQSFGGTTRAFLWHSTPQGPDDTLAHNDQPGNTQLPYVCEIAVGASDAGSD